MVTKNTEVFSSESVYGPVSKNIQQSETNAQSDLVGEDNKQKITIVGGSSSSTTKPSQSPITNKNINAGVISSSPTSTIEAESSPSTKVFRVEDRGTSYYDPNTGNGGYITSTGKTTTSYSEALEDAKQLRYKNEQIKKSTTSQPLQSYKYTGGDGQITEANTKEKIAMRLKRTPVVGDVYDFFSGFSSTVLRSTESQKRQLNYRDIETLETGEAVGATLGNVANIYLSSDIAATLFPKIGSKIITTGGKAKQAFESSKTIQQAKQVIEGSKTIQKAKKLSQTQPAKFVKDFGTTILRGYGIIEGSKQISKLTAPKEQRDLMNQEGFRKSVKLGFEAEKEQVSQEPFYRTLAYEGISSLISSKKSKQSYDEAVRSELKRQGLSSEEIETGVKAARRFKTGAGLGEIGALLDISRSSEKIGRGLVAEAFEKSSQKGEQFVQKKAFSTLFKKTAPVIGVAGFVEGFSQELTQQQSREQDFNIKTSALMGGIGFGTAGLLGGVIAGTSLNKPVVSKTLEYGSYLIDPYEKPGDLLADLGENIARRAGRQVKTPTISGLIDQGPKLSVGVQSSTTTNIQKKKGKPQSFENVGIFDTPLVLTPSIQTEIPKPSNLPNIISGKSKSPVPSPVPLPEPNVPIIDSILTPINIPPDEPQPQETPVNINVNTPVNIPIPVISPYGRVPPPLLPMDFGSSNLNVGTMQGKRVKYVNELEQSLAVLRKGLGTDFIKPNIKSKTKKSKSKKSKSNTKNNMDNRNNPFSALDMAFRGF